MKKEYLMNKLVVFKSYCCKLEDFYSVELIYPEGNNLPITVEVTLENGEKKTIFASSNVLSCWLFLETLKIIDINKISYEKSDLDNNEIFDKYDNALKMINEIRDNGCLNDSKFYCCGQKLNYLSEVAIGKKWFCEKCQTKYDTRELITKGEKNA